MMLSKLMRKKRNVTGFMKIFFVFFWIYVESLSTEILEENKEDQFDSLANSYDLVGKVNILLF
jgi:hypothetical protein